MTQWQVVGPEDTPLRLVHLKAHDINPDTATLGPWLELDPKNECFKDNAKANELVKGFYRKPWTVPEVMI